MKKKRTLEQYATRELSKRWGEIACSTVLKILPVTSTQKFSDPSVGPRFFVMTQDSNKTHTIRILSGKQW